MLVAVPIPGQHFDGGEILAVVERELRAQHLRHVERLVLLVAHVAAHERFVDGVLLDGGRAEAIARAGLELDGDLGDVCLRIDAHLVAQHARIEVAVGGGGALQVALDLFVAGVVEPLAGAQRQIVGDAGEERVVGAGAGDVHVDVLDHHRLAGLDVDGHAPVAAADVLELHVRT